ncbi:A/G-specific adenine glycosylase [Acinetobacter larvae]|uniref:Adenine DNA glycosylase n=1 Tax=Acinetobacter larvae TaxID=1789224 RepID=A0A1B2LVK2_9GAMM|nr:A/G-specific adenine glycosylase [Acinetobacter larvae]AOA56945.1 A/G-specific adenine glycosylase [Acinetobacter larvae]
MTGFSFADALLTWFDQHGRHDLPWQVADDPYKVWVSEIMLQQTQVKTVLQYFDRFIQRFPTVHHLAQATWEEVAPYWAGLGYYARARNLHKAAAIVASEGLPNNLAAWMALPGIGRSTGGALMSLGLRQYGVIMDGNVKRVLSRFYGLSQDLTTPAAQRELWQLAEALCPVERNHDYTQAIMDLGATICTPKKPLCLYCPMQPHCQAYLEGMTAQIPFKKPKTAVPIKTAQVLLFATAQQPQTWLWQQRPNQGLWGGLWSLPIIEDPQHWQQLVQQYALQHKPMQTQITHHFTHFTWHLQAYQIMIPSAQQPALAEHWQATWLENEQAAAQGIPTAMKKLISALKV